MSSLKDSTTCAWLVQYLSYLVVVKDRSLGGDSSE